MYISNKFSHHICDKLLEQEIIQANTYPYYQYSFDYVLDLILFHCSLLIIGFCLHAPFLSLLYILTLTPLKMFSGGAHADTQISCSVISYAIFLIGILITKHHLFALHAPISIFVFVTFSFIIFLLSPIDCKNKKIPFEQKRTYKIRCGFILCLQFFAFLNIGICDDDKLYIKEITKLLDRYMIQYDIDISYDTFTSPLVLLNRISTTPGCYDILFLDVEMSEMNGLELSEKIRFIRHNIYTIFISNYPKYMQDSFRVHPFYYLVKPLSAETFTNIMNDILSAIQSEHKLVTLLHTDCSEETVDLGDILCIEVTDGKKELLDFHLFDHILHAKGKISAWQEKLASYDFFPCHRKYLVNLTHIHYFEKNHVILDNGFSIPISRGNEKILKDRYNNNIVRLKKL